MWGSQIMSKFEVGMPEC